MGSPVHALLFVATGGVQMDADKRAGTGHRCYVMEALRLRGVGIEPKRVVFECQDVSGLWDGRGVGHMGAIGWPSGHCADCAGDAVCTAG